MSQNITSRWKSWVRWASWRYFECICYEFRTKLRNVEGIITYSLGEDYCHYDFWENSAEDTEETNSSDKTENCTEEIEYEDPDPDFGEYDIHRPLTHLNPEKGTKFYFHYGYDDEDFDDSFYEDDEE